MVHFSLISLALAYASVVAPSPINRQYSTHPKREFLGSRKTITSFSPPTRFESYGKGIDQPENFLEPSFEDNAISFIKAKTGVQDVALKSTIKGQVADTAYVQQSHDGVKFSNAVAHVAFNGEGKVVAFGSSFVNTDKIAPSTPSVPVNAAISTAEKELGAPHNDHPPKIEYLARPDGTVALTHVIQVQNVDAGIWQQAYIDAHTGEVASIVDFAAGASYHVLPIRKQYLFEGFEVLENPQDVHSSPLGWHDDGNTKYLDTAGNNAIAYKGNATDTTAQSSEGLNFVYIQDPTQDPTASVNLDAARTNAFYAVNTVHDIVYKYGFTEAAFNFQDNNFGKGGMDKDRVHVSVQDSGGLDNAVFFTPPDGQSGVMQIFPFDFTKPSRDGALENDIVVHENTHGITNRLTGGGTATCLQTLESKGLGEGWSDAMAEWIRQKDGSVQDFTLGSYVANMTSGIRHFPYSTNAQTNPLRYSSLASLRRVHDIGEVWANMLHIIYAALVESHGFSLNAHTDPTTSEGNVVWLHHFIDALSIQPCQPTFVTARDAWIQADANRYGGANKCLLWNAFASRGLGVKAANNVDDSSVPDECSGPAVSPTHSPSPTPSAKS